MTIFRYEAADANGKVLRGAMDAPTAQEVTRRLTDKGFRYVQVHENAGVNGAMAAQMAAGAAGRPAAVGIGVPKPEDLGVFFRQVASLMHAGFTVSNTLADLGPRTANRGLRSATIAMATAVAGGASLAGQMALYPMLFPPHVIGLVAAGETGGFLEFSFEEAALGMEQDAALRQGLWLTKFLLWQSVWSVLLFQPLFPSIDLNNIGQSTVNYGRALLFIAVPLGVGLHLLAALVGWMRRQPFARDFFDGLSLGLPFMARLAHARAMSAFTRVLRRLLMAGVSVEPAFAAAVNSVPNAALRERMRAGQDVLRSGGGMDAAMQATRMLGHDPLQLLITGQKTGQFVEMLDRVTAYYQEEAARATDAARAAQKRLGILLTIITSGYVMCAATYYGYRLMFKFTDNLAQ